MYTIFCTIKVNIWSKHLYIYIIIIIVRIRGSIGCFTLLKHEELVKAADGVTEIETARLLLMSWIVAKTHKPYVHAGAIACLSNTTRQLVPQVTFNLLKSKFDEKYPGIKFDRRVSYLPLLITYMIK